MLDPLIRKGWKGVQQACEAVTPLPPLVWEHRKKGSKAPDILLDVEGDDTNSALKTQAQMLNLQVRFTLLMNA